MQIYCTIRNRWISASDDDFYTDSIEQYEEWIELQDELKDRRAGLGDIHEM